MASMYSEIKIKAELRPCMVHDPQQGLVPAPVVPGLWIELAFGELKCSACGIIQEDDAFPYNYCPHCGTKMVAKEAQHE